MRSFLPLRIFTLSVNNDIMPAPKRESGGKEKVRLRSPEFQDRPERRNKHSRYNRLMENFKAAPLAGFGAFLHNLKIKSRKAGGNDK
jgi:hypothetical protein